MCHLYSAGLPPQCLFKLQFRDRLCIDARNVQQPIMPGFRSQVCGLPRHSVKWFVSLPLSVPFYHNRVFQRAQPFDGDPHHVTGPQPALGFAGRPHTAGRARGDQVARFQGHKRGEVCNQFIDGKDRVAGIGRLQNFAVDGELNVQIVGVGDLVGGDQGLPHGAESVKGLAHGPLAGAHTVIPCAHIIEGQVARHIVQSVRGPFITGRASDDKGEFSLVVHLLGASEQDNRHAGADHRVVVLGKDSGMIRDGLVRFHGVIPIVEADAENFPRAGQGCLQCQCGWGQKSRSRGGCDSFLGQIFGVRPASQKGEHVCGQGGIGPVEIDSCIIRNQYADAGVAVVDKSNQFHVFLSNNVGVKI